MRAPGPPLLPAGEILARSSGPPPDGGVVGRSREGREIPGFRFGSGPLHVSLIAGCHADEPVGPALLEKLVRHLASLPPEAPALTRASWWILPHLNPDGRAANTAWQREPIPLPSPPGSSADRGPFHGYDLALYLAHVVREPPGDDVEFGFPRSPDDHRARPESRAAAAFLADGAPFHLHATLHGMAFAAGPWFLLEASWADRTRDLRRRLRRRVAALGYGLHDVDRKGEKGFSRLDEGFSTRPDSAAMSTHFRARGDEATARLFRPSSMEHVRSLGGDPLTLVSEMPLFLVEEPPAASPERPPLPADAEGRARFHQWLAGLAAQGSREQVLQRAAQAGLRPMPVEDQMRLQLAFVEEGLAVVARENPAG